MLCRASKPLKSVALSYSANVSIGWISLQYVLPIISNYPDGTFTIFVLPPHRPLARRVQFAQLCNDFTSLGFGQARCLRFHPFPIANLQRVHIIGLRSNELPRFHLFPIPTHQSDSDMSKLCTYQLHARQLLRLKVRT